MQGAGQPVEGLVVTLEELVTCWERKYLVDHTCKSSSGVRTTGESKDAVPCLV